MNSIAECGAQIFLEGGGLGLKCGIPPPSPNENETLIPGLDCLLELGGRWRYSSGSSAAADSSGLSPCPSPSFVNEC